MSQAEHGRAVRAALGVDGELRRVMAGLGSAEHPNGRVLRAYRVARRSLRANGGLRPPAVAETLQELRGTMLRVAMDTLADAAGAGAASARKQLAAYDVPARPTMYNSQPALQAWLSVVDGQAAAVQAAVATGADPALIVGDAEQPGLLNPSPATREGSRWAAIAAMMAWWAWINGSLPGQRQGGPDGLQKQVVAALDERTTDCCLRAHGQVVDLDADFELRGEPKYADRLQWTPFHWYCRSSIALVRRQDAGDGLTQQMVEAARAELRAREDGSRTMIHPAHARSRR